MDNDETELKFDVKTGFLKSIRSKSNGRSTPCSMQFSAYPSSASHSGAYLFETKSKNGKQPNIDVLNGTRPQIIVATGPVMSEVSVSYGQLLTHRTVLFHNKKPLGNVIRMESNLNMGAYPNYVGHEFFIRFQTDIRNVYPPNSKLSEFFTDQNGYSFARRVQTAGMGVEANYYPITSAAFIQDENYRLNVLVNAAKGFTSPKLGAVEWMLDRRTAQDDGRGVGEGMTENNPTTTSFILLLEKRQQLTVSNVDHQQLSLGATLSSTALMYPSRIFTVESGSKGTAESKNALMAFGRLLFLNQPMPCNVQMIGLRTLSEPGFLEADLPSSNALLTLHNRAFDCSIVVDKGSPVCGLTDGDDRIFYPKTNFLGLELETMEQTSLTGLESLGTVNFDSARLPPMSLGSFNLTFV